MFSWVTNPQVWGLLLSVLVSIPLVSLLTWIVFAVGSAGRMGLTIENPLVLLCFSSLGITMGILAASSDSSALAPLLPAVLSLVGGIATYLVSRQAPGEAVAGDRMIIAASVTALSLTLFIGALIGAEMRQRADAHRESAEYKKYLVDVEREVEDYRRAQALKSAVPNVEQKIDQVLAEFARRKLD